MVSGGERSFTTLSLLLALGEMLETPFRVMDEFDVFLDPMSRKIALNTMVSLPFYLLKLASRIEVDTCYTFHHINRLALQKV